MVQKEIDKLRGSIQTLTRSVNPLGKIMDFVQEDLDSMQKELEVWKKENGQNQVALQREQRYVGLTVYFGLLHMIYECSRGFAEIIGRQMCFSTQISYLRFVP